MLNFPIIALAVTTSKSTLQDKVNNKFEENKRVMTAFSRKQRIR
jgi:Flp pilus assembly pilin Flp